MSLNPQKQKYLILTKEYIRVFCLHSIYSDQNFGINDLAAIQDVRNDFNLQDITDEPQPVSAALTKDRGKFATKCL